MDANKYDIHPATPPLLLDTVSHNSVVVLLTRVYRNLISICRAFSAQIIQTISVHGGFIDESELFASLSPGNRIQHCTPSSQPAPTLCHGPTPGKRKLSLKVWYSFYSRNPIHPRKLHRKYNLMTVLFSPELLLWKGGKWSNFKSQNAVTQ